MARAPSSIARRVVEQALAERRPLVRRLVIGSVLAEPPLALGERPKRKSPRPRGALPVPPTPAATGSRDE